MINDGRVHQKIGYGTRTCPGCKTVFPFTEEHFTRNGKTVGGQRYNYRCRTCVAAKQRKDYAARIARAEAGEIPDPRKRKANHTAEAWARLLEDRRMWSRLREERAGRALGTQREVAPTYYKFTGEQLLPGPPLAAYVEDAFSRSEGTDKDAFCLAAGTSARRVYDMRQGSGVRIGKAQTIIELLDGTLGDVYPELVEQ